jgi:hypothetical protein
MRLVGPGLLDVPVLGQSVYWVTSEAQVLRLDEMTAAHLQAAAQMLLEQALPLHFWTVVATLKELRASMKTGVPCGEALQFAVTGTSLADVEPNVWLASTPLMRAIARRLACMG